MRDAFVTKYTLKKCFSLGEQVEKEGRIVFVFYYTAAHGCAVFRLPRKCDGWTSCKGKSSRCKAKSRC